VTNPPEMWIRRDTAYEPIVSGDIFSRAQAIIRERGKRFTDEELLDQLRSLMEQREDYPVCSLMRGGLPSSSVYRTRFGSLIGHISLSGTTPSAIINSLKRTGNCA